MCSVDKMLIKGIRSFSPDNNAVITFYKPLTLIVGPNGAGKTTVIECLKYACTGELPPNSRSGHSFIHDPKVAGETETKGQIKLRFKSGAGKDVVCIRSFQLTQKASKLEYKAIESVLQTINAHTGEKVCLSYRCADMDREVPTLMGVSKAILENVIFVHQDEANWPLAEGAVLKKKFDDIFSATRYTKALEVIKKLHKDQAQLIKEYRLKLDHLQTIRDSSCKLHESVEGEKQKARELEEKMKVLQDRVAAGRDTIASLEETLKSVRKVQEEMKVKEGKREIVSRRRLQQYNDLEVENEDTDEELTAWQANFESSLSTLRLKITKTESEIREGRSLLAMEKEKYEKLCTVKGRLQAESEAHSQDKRDRDEALLAICRSQGLPLPDHLSIPLPPDQAGRLSQAVVARLDELQRNLEELQASNRAEQQKVNAVKEGVQSKILEALGQVKLLEKQKVEREQSLLAMEATIQRVAVSESDVRRVEDREKSAKEELDRAGQLLREDQLDAELDSLKSAEFTLGQKLKSLQRDKDALAADSEDRLALTLKMEALEEKEKALKDLLSDERKESLRRALNGSLPAEKDLVKEMDKIISSNKQALTAVESQAKAVGEEVAALSMRAQDANKTLTSKVKEREVKRQVLTDRIFATLKAQVEAESLEEQLAAAKKDMEGKKRDHDLLDGMRRCFSRFMEMAEMSHECPLCERPFGSPQELDSFIRKQRTNQSQSADKLRAAAVQHTELQSRVRGLDQLRPLYSEYTSLSQEAIPHARRMVEDTQEALAAAMERQDEVLSVLGQMAMEHESVQKLYAPCAEVDRLFRECETLRSQVADMRYRIDSSTQGLRSLSDVNAEFASLEAKREECARKREKVQEEVQRRKDDFSSWNVRWRNAREEKLIVTEKVNKLEEARENARQLQSQLRQLDLDIQMWDEQLEPLRMEASRVDAEQREQREAAEREESAARSRLRAMERQVDEMRACSSRISAFLEGGKEEELGKVMAHITHLLEAQRQRESAMAALAQQLAGDQKLLESEATIKRSIEDNLQYRKTAKEEQELVQEVERLREELLASGDVAKIEKEVKGAMQELQGWNAELNRIHGALQTHEANIRANQGSLRAPQYRDIDSKYRSQLIQLKTTEMANKDLDKYHTALDRALMRFHSMKMEEINKIVKELWQQTYRGQDIDYIEIRSDAEGAGTRSYSYRVVMHSGDAELDMRGRCSAGQKVLASLVIRLALAETFCLNCGILALDEPTTNLDYPNADSLAAALLRIMEDRKGQSNFQLIVITHDERFAQMIGQKQHAERYYRISKDEHQHSKIEVQDIFE